MAHEIPNEEPADNSRPGWLLPVLVAVSIAIFLMPTPAGMPVTAHRLIAVAALMAGLWMTQAMAVPPHPAAQAPTISRASKTWWAVAPPIPFLVAVRPTSWRAAMALTRSLAAEVPTPSKAVLATMTTP